MSGITHASYYLPEDTLEVAKILEQIEDPRISRDEVYNFFVNQNGLERVPIERKKDQVEMLSLLLDGYFAAGASKPEEIGYVIYTSSYNLLRGNVCIPYLLQAKYGLVNASLVLCQQQCISVLQAIELAGALIDSGKAENVLILSIVYGFAEKERFLGTSILGDGAGLMVVGKNGCQARLAGSASISDGGFSYHRYYEIPEKGDSFGLSGNIKKGAEFTRLFLEKKKLGLEDVRLLIPLNINRHGYFMFSRLSGIRMNKLFLNNLSRGHLADVDTIMNYADAIRGQSFNKGDKFLLYGSGTIGRVDNHDTIHNLVLLEYDGECGFKEQKEME
ncbi:MAG: hypothetical protein QHH10_02810 [Peptococcaceae bacterium]|jgi:3-oxoacyl-[acyl-carrier-protein] synthase III|nr:hypothetical protein [Peptococcaceae bacterium]MDH7524225.1 hypothetical protein [Peptococcaceae bacterium]